MIIDKIKIERVAVLKPKDYAPVSAHSDAPEFLQFSFQWMQSPTWK